MESQAIFSIQSLFSIESVPRLMVATSTSPNGTFQMVNERANVEVRVGKEKKNLIILQ